MRPCCFLTEAKKTERTGDALKGTQAGHELCSPPFHGRKNGVPFLLEERERRIPLLGWCHHRSDKQLAYCVRAEGNTHKLLHLRDDHLWNVEDVEVATPVATLTKKALGDGVEGEERGARNLLVERNLPEGCEGLAVVPDVVLIDLVRDDRDACCRAQLQQLRLKRYPAFNELPRPRMMSGGEL